MFGNLKGQFPYVLPDVIFDLIRQQKDYYAGPLDGMQHPKRGIYYKGAIASPDDPNRLEDIDESWVCAYFEDMLVGIKKNTDNSLNQYERETITKTLYFDNESGSVSDPSEHRAEKLDYSATEMTRWREKLPYILKRLHERSKEVKIHLLSLVFAYEKARAEAIAYERKIKPSHILDKNVYAMNPNGTIGLVLKENKHTTHEYLAWIRGEGERDEYFENVLELVYICERLGIDLKKESAFDYQEEYINGLIITYVTANREIRNRINKDVYAGLKNISLKDFGKKKKENTALEYHKLVRRKANQFLYSVAPDIVKFRDNRNIHHEMPLLVRQLANISKTNEIITKNTSLDDGFYLDPNGNYLTVDVKAIFTMFPLRFYRALIHSSGFLVLITGDISMFYIDYTKARAYLADVYKGTISEETRYENKTKFGTWEEARI